MMFADIYPVQRLPRATGPFTYKLPDDPAEQAKLQPGAWARMPFRNAESDGIVWRLRKTAPEGVRRFLRAAPHPSEAALTSEQRALFADLSEQTSVSIAVVLTAFLPEYPKRRPKDEMQTSRVHAEAAPLRITPNRAHAIQEAIATMQEDRGYFFPLGSLAERVFFAQTMCARHPKNQILVLSPTRAHAELMAAHLRKHARRPVVLLHRGLAKTQYYDAWTSVRSNDNAIIVTTKHGLGAPFHSVAAVLIDGAADDSHKQSEQNPRYDARALAHIIAHSFSAPLVFLDAQMPLALSVDANVQRDLLPPQPQRRMAFLRPAVPMPFADRLLLPDTRRLLVDTKGPVLLLYNRSGGGRFLRCLDCEWMLLCASCATPTRLHRGTPLPCPRCAAVAVLPHACPQCKSLRIKEVGHGTSSIRSVVSSIFPDRTIAQYDRESDELPKDFDMLVSTERIVSAANVNRFSALAILHLEQLFQFPDIRVLERAYLLVERLAALVAPGGPVIVQTDNVSQALVTSFLEQDPKPFYDQELTMRQQLQFPPAHRVLKLIGSYASASEADTGAAELCASLRSALGTSASVTDPVIPHIDPEHRTFHRFLLVRPLQPKQNIATLRAVFCTLPDEWFVDNDPDTFV